jgi:hypothetical protein
MIIRRCACWMLSLSSPASMNVNIGVPSYDKAMIVRTVSEVMIIGRR